MRNYEEYDFNFEKSNDETENILMFASINNISLEEAQEVFQNIQIDYSQQMRSLNVIKKQLTKLNKLKGNQLEWINKQELFNCFVK